MNNNEAKDVPYFNKWRVPISVTGGGHVSPAPLTRSGRFFAKSAKNLSVKSCYKICENERIEIYEWSNKRIEKGFR